MHCSIRDILSQSISPEPSLRRASSNHAFGAPKILQAFKVDLGSSVGILTRTKVRRLDLAEVNGVFEVAKMHMTRDVLIIVASRPNCGGRREVEILHILAQVVQRLNYVILLLPGGEKHASRLPNPQAVRGDDQSRSDRDRQDHNDIRRRPTFEPTQYDGHHRRNYADGVNQPFRRGEEQTDALDPTHSGGRLHPSVSGIESRLIDDDRR